MPTANGGTFQPLLHRSGTLRERLHSYTKRTLGAGGSINEAVRENAASSAPSETLVVRRQTTDRVDALSVT